MILLPLFLIQSLLGQRLNCPGTTSFFISTFGSGDWFSLDNGELTSSTGQQICVSLNQPYTFNSDCTSYKFGLQRSGSSVYMIILDDPSFGAVDYITSFGNNGQFFEISYGPDKSPDYTFTPLMDSCGFFNTPTPPPPPPPKPVPPPPSKCCMIKGQKYCGLACDIPKKQPPPSPPSKPISSGCQKDLRSCQHFFKCNSDADCPTKDWICAIDTKSCVLKTEEVALQSYIHAGHKDPFNPTASQKRSLLPGNETELLYKRGSNFWPRSHGESFALSVFAQYAYQENVKTLGKEQGLCTSYTILDTFQYNLFGLESIIYSNANGYYILAFKGTSSIAETILDISANPNHYPDVTRNENSVIHNGFYTAYKSLRDKFMNVLGPLKESGKFKKLGITGHSLGAAMAQIATLDLTYRGFKVEFNYNFGAPRVGNQAFQDEYAQATPRVQKAFLSLSYWFSDPITHLPPTLMPFFDGVKPVFYADPPNFYYVDCKPDNLWGDGCKTETLHDSDRYSLNLKRIAGGSDCYDLPQPIVVITPKPPPSPKPVPKPTPSGGQCTYKKH